MTYIPTVVLIPVTRGGQPQPGALVTLRLQQTGVVVASTSLNAKTDTVATSGADGVAMLSVPPSQALYAVGQGGPVTYQLIVALSGTTLLTTSPFAMPTRTPDAPLTLAQLLVLAGMRPGEAPSVLDLDAVTLQGHAASDFPLVRNVTTVPPNNTLAIPQGFVVVANQIGVVLIVTRNGQSTTLPPGKTCLYRPA